MVQGKTLLPLAGQERGRDPRGDTQAQGEPGKKSPSASETGPRPRSKRKEGAERLEPDARAEPHATGEHELCG